VEHVDVRFPGTVSLVKIWNPLADCKNIRRNTAVAIPSLANMKRNIFEKSVIPTWASNGVWAE
jgi:hypothetical protein